MRLSDRVADSRVRAQNDEVNDQHTVPFCKVKTFRGMEVVITLSLLTRVVPMTFLISFIFESHITNCVSFVNDLITILNKSSNNIFSIFFVESLTTVPDSFDLQTTTDTPDIKFELELLTDSQTVSSLPSRKIVSGPDPRKCTIPFYGRTSV